VDTGLRWGQLASRRFKRHCQRGVAELRRLHNAARTVKSSHPPAQRGSKRQQRRKSMPAQKVCDECAAVCDKEKTAALKLVLRFLYGGGV
jgi:hypothetical protein